MIVIADVAVIGPVIESVNVNVNPTVIVIMPVIDKLAIAVPAVVAWSGF